MEYEKVGDFLKPSNVGKVFFVMNMKIQNVEKSQTNQKGFLKTGWNILES